MAFPSAGGTKADDLETAWRVVRGTAYNIKQQATRLRDLSAASGLAGGEIVQFATTLADSKDDLARYTAVPGLVAYVRSQINDATIDIVAEYNTMLTQITATTAWIIANFPKDGGGNLLYQQLDANGRTTFTTFTPVATTGFRTVLTSLIGTIN